MRGLRLGLSLGRGQAGTPAAFSIAFTGLSTDSIGTYGQVGNHAAIGYTINPDNGTETVKWSNSSNPADAATYGTGAAPTDFTASDGSPVYLHVTDGGDTVTRSFTVRKAPATGGADLDLAFPEDSAISSTNLIANWTTNSNTLTYVSVSPALPTGLSINSAGTMTGTPTTVTADDTYTLTMEDAYGRQVSDTFTLEITVVLQLSAVDLGAQESDGDVPATLTGDNGTYYWILTTTDPAVSPPTRTQVLAGQDHTGSAAAADGTVAITSGTPVNVSLPTGLNGSYYLVVADGDSILFDGTAQAIDTTAPVLSSVSTTPGDTTADLDWSTDTGSGTAYWILTTSATPPSNAAIIAGTGAVGSNFGSAAISGTGAQTTITATSLTNGTTYYFHLFHRDAFSNDSTVSTTSVVPAAASSPLAYLGHRATTGNGPSHTFATGGLSAVPSAGDRVVIAVMADRWDGTDRVTSVLVDPGGGNETAATYRTLTEGGSNQFVIEVFDVIWPASSDFAVQITRGRSGFVSIAIAILNANTLAYTSAVAQGNTATGGTGEVTVNGTFTAGSGVAMFTYGTYNSTVSILGGLDSISVFTTDRTNVVGVDEAATGSATDYQLDVEAAKTGVALLVEYA